MLDLINRMKIMRLNSSMCGVEKKHICAVLCGNFTHKTVLKKNIVIGINNYIYQGNKKSIHAEEAALDRIQYSKQVRNKYFKNKIKRKISVSIIVIRVTKTGKLAESKPCYHCVVKMLRCKFLKIRYIYFSNSNGDIEKLSLTELCNSSLHISSGYSGWEK